MIIVVCCVDLFCRLSRRSCVFFVKCDVDVAAGDGQDVNTNDLVSRAARRKTDLMPTIPSPRDKTFNSRPGSGTRSLARTPGRAYSMARLDVLSRPRKTSEQTQAASAELSKSMSRSTNHLLDSDLAFPSNSLKKTNASKSMVQLGRHQGKSGGVQPRTTRAERLRNKARAKSQAGNSDTATSSPGNCSLSVSQSVTR